jgi:choline dehydrogenase-like flavoprotein
MTHYDVIIIGTGAGGGTLAYHLAPSGKRILLIERGDYVRREKDNWSSRAVNVEGKYNTKEVWQDKAGEPLHPHTNYYVGGNTKFYGAALFRLRQKDFGEIVHHGGLSPAWPISYDDLEPYYTKAEHLYQVHGERGVDPTEPWASAPYKFPAVQHEPRIQQLHDNLVANGLRPFHVPLGIMLDESNSATSRCIRCETCDGFPCLIHAKCDAQVICVDPALTHPNVTLITNAKVTRLVTSTSGREVAAVAVQRNGTEELFSGDIVVSSCGAINSAALLLRSATDRHPNGLANGSGVVGRHYMGHVNSVLLAISKSPNPTVFQKTLGVNDFYFGDPDGDGSFPYPLGAMQMLGKNDATLIAFDAPDAGDPADLARHSMDFWLTTEDLPLAGNRVILGRDGRIRLRYTQTNAEAHQRLIGKFKGLLDAIQCRQDVLPGYHYLGGRLGIGAVAHQNGTVRFGTDPAASALDINCKMHELDNLYVADSSFFVSSTAVNPTLTIIANALRVADHIAERLGATAGAQAQPALTGVTGHA